MNQIAYDLFVTIKGHSQGQFMGAVREKGYEGAIAALALSYDVTQPTQAEAGVGAGKVQHSPVTIVKEWDTASTQIYTALITAEILDTVLFAYVPTVDPGGGGKLDPGAIHHTILLKNALVSKISHHRDSPAPGSSGHAQDLEEISFVFEQIEFSNPQGGTATTQPAPSPAPAQAYSRASVSSSKAENMVDGLGASSALVISR